MRPPEIAAPARVRVSADSDIVAARQQGRTMALQLGFRPIEATLIATSISELARNILLYARQGEIEITPIERGERRGLSILARDDGPGIVDVAQAMEDGFSSNGRLGLGLPGVRRLMDSFEIRSSPEGGTTVVAKKWMS